MRLASPLASFMFGLGADAMRLASALPASVNPSREALHAALDRMGEPSKPYALQTDAERRETEKGWGEKCGVRPFAR